MSEIMDINNQLFKVIKASTKEGQYIVDLPYKAHDLWTAYDRPSARKAHIWEYWKKWADEIGVTIWISSRNTSAFCIGFHGIYDGLKVWGWITPSYNKVVIG